MGHCTRFKSITTDLDLEPNSSGDESGFSPDEYKIHLKKIYTDTVEKVATMVLEQTKKTERTALLEEKAVERVIEAGPSEILSQAVRDEVRAMKGKGKSTKLPEGYDYKRLATDTFIAGTVPFDIENYTSKPKNGPSPAVRAGAKSSSKPKGKSKGSKGKSKGKGKGQNPTPTKGKGTSKGKDQTNRTSAKGSKSKGKGNTASKNKSASKGGRKGKGGKKGSKGTR